MNLNSISVIMNQLIVIFCLLILMTLTQANDETIRFPMLMPDVQPLQVCLIIFFLYHNIWKSCSSVIPTLPNFLLLFIYPFDNNVYNCVKLMLDFLSFTK